MSWPQTSHLQFHPPGVHIGGGCSDGQGQAQGEEAAPASPTLGCGDQLVDQLVEVI